MLRPLQASRRRAGNAESQTAPGRLLAVSSPSSDRTQGRGSQDPKRKRTPPCPIQVLPPKALLQFALGFPGTEDQDGLRIVNESNHRIVVVVEMSREASQLAVIRHHALPFIATLER
jgi:hypothetical protein